jgi:hypothetical protein
MERILSQIESTLDSGNYIPALFTALALPDICGAVDSADGRASGASYKTWFDAHVGDKYKLGDWVFLDGDGCYYFRCSLLHQGSSIHPKQSYSRIEFIEPGSTKSEAHCVIIDNTLVIDVVTFCRDLVAGARTWLATKTGDQQAKAKLDKLLSRRTGNLTCLFGVDLPTIG